MFLSLASTTKERYDRTRQKPSRNRTDSSYLIEQGIGYIRSQKKFVSFVLPIEDALLTIDTYRKITSNKLIETILVHSILEDDKEHINDNLIRDKNTFR